MLYEEKIIETIPVGPLGLVPLKSCTELGKKVDQYLVEWRRERESEHKSTIAFSGYQRDSYIIESKTPRFGSGEAKGTIEESVRGDDLYFMVDVCNYSLTYSLCGQTNHMSPDDHFQDLKRLIAAAAGKARRINVIMPFLYESRQHKRSSRESLDCALALQELTHMGVENIITFDAHDPRVQNAIPLKGFETVQPIYQFIKHLLKYTARFIPPSSGLITILWKHFIYVRVICIDLNSIGFAKMDPICNFYAKWCKARMFMTTCKGIVDIHLGCMVDRLKREKYSFIFERRINK